MIGHLQHHTASSVIVQGAKEWNDIGDVVDDVVGSDNVSIRRRVSHGWPESLNCQNRNPVLFGVRLEHNQHLGLLVHSNHVCGRRRQRECRHPTTAADVEHGAALGNRITRPIVRRRSFDDVRNLEKNRRMNPRAFFRRRQNVVGQGPGVERLAPALSRGGHRFSAPRGARRNPHSYSTSPPPSSLGRCSVGS